MSNSLVAAVTLLAPDGPNLQWRESMTWFWWLPATFAALLLVVTFLAVKRSLARRG